MAKKTRTPKSFLRKVIRWVIILIALGSIGTSVFFKDLPYGKRTYYLNYPIQKIREFLPDNTVQIDHYKGNKEDLYAGYPANHKYPNAIQRRNLKGFIVGYDNQRKNPAWVAYRLFHNDVWTSLPRPSFKKDPHTAYTVRPDAYKDSGYDRGHMAPNYAICTRYGKRGQADTFYMSNMVPQSPTLNRGIWRELEHRVANVYAPCYEEVWVLTGPIYNEKPKKLKSGIHIPEAFYKIILDEKPTGVRVQAFIIPQQTKSSSFLWPYRSSVNEIEQETGLDFFPLLPDELEEELESTKNLIVW